MATDWIPPSPDRRAEGKGDPPFLFMLLILIVALMSLGLWRDVDHGDD